MPPLAANSTNVKVGLLVILGIVSFAAIYSFLQARRMGGRAVEYWALFGDASGLSVRAEVRVAGVQVGEISSIELQAGRARVNIRVRPDLDVYPNAVLSKRSSSILGDALLELDPGFSAPIERPGGPVGMTEPLPPGSQIRTVHEGASMERLIESLSEITQDVRRITSSLDRIVSSETGSIQQIVRSVEDLTGRLQRLVARSTDDVDRILDNTLVVSENLRRITSGKDDDIAEILANARALTREAREAIASFRGSAGEDEGGMATVLGRLDNTLRHLESIVQKIDRGEGALGRLVSDERLGERVAAAMEGVSNYVTRLDALQTEVSLRTEYLFRAESAKNYVTLRLIPAPDQFFMLQLVDDPLGFVRRESVLRSPPGEDEAAQQEIRTTSDVLKFSVELAKRYSFLSLRFGLIESTGGFGVDLDFFDDRLRFTADAFDFARSESSFPRIRLFTNVTFIPHFYLTVGLDDVFSSARYDPVTGRFRMGRDFFAGAGLSFSDEDLKVLFGTISGGLP